MMKQKDAVYNAIVNMYEFSGDGAVELNRQQRADVIEVLYQGFVSKSISFDGDLPVDNELRSYCSGLLSNWLRKDTRLNGGVKYQAKNPGSRTGSTDPQIKALRILMSTKTDPSEVAEIQAFIDKRLAEIKPTKAVTLNIDDVPAELRHLIKH
jgi:hypothetical protein